MNVYSKVAMKFCQVLLAGLFLSGIAWAQCSGSCVQVKAGSNAGAGTTLMVTFDGAETSGNANVVHVIFCGNNACTQDTTACSMAISDGTNTYTAAVENRENVNFYAGTFTAPNVAAATPTITATVTEGGACVAHYISMLIGEWTGIATASIVDQTGKATGTSTTPSVSTTGATTQNDEVVIGFIWSTDTLFNPSPGAGYAQSNTDASGDRIEEFKNVAATGVQTADGSIGASVVWVANIITLKEAAAGGATRQPCCLLGVFD